MIRETGRPERTEGRLPREVRCYEVLDRLGIAYTLVDHPEKPAFTMEICRELEGVLGAPICKNLLLTNRQQTKFFLLLMPGEKPFKTKELSAQINSARLSFASAEQMLRLLDIEPGALSILGLANDKENAVTLLVDEDLLREEWLGVHPCVNTSCMRIRTEDVFGRFTDAVRHPYTTVRLVGEEQAAGDS